MDCGQLLGRVVEQVPDVQPLRRRIRHGSESGHPESALAVSVLRHGWAPVIACEF
jgi:hypothetical protein